MHSWVEAWFLPLPLKAQRPWWISRSHRWDLAACWTRSARISQGASTELLTSSLVLVWELQRFSKCITESSLLFHPPLFWTRNDSTSFSRGLWMCAPANLCRTSEEKCSELQRSFPWFVTHRSWTVICTTPGVHRPEPRTGKQMLEAAIGAPSQSQAFLQPLLGAIQ